MWSRANGQLRIIKWQSYISQTSIPSLQNSNPNENNRLRKFHLWVTMSMVKMINDYRYRVLPHLDWWRGGSHPHFYRLHVTSNLLRAMKVEHDFYKFEEFKWEGRQKCETKLLLSLLYLLNDISEWTENWTAQSV